ncbi:MAG: permease of the drug/metabolite transporter superfamily, partial [Caulobacteraceae bacterium]|nr:permease of the drug/metabolite transporter superfamily [Caulobacteraceae bacterium]
MLWIALTVLAAPLQVGRNVMQRGLVGDAGPWGATLVRFLFGLPFALMIFGVVAMFTPHAAPHLSWRFAIAIVVGGLAQIAATAALLASMHRTSFAIATVMQSSSLPLSALAGWALFGDALSPVGTVGVMLTTIALVVLSWPRRDQAHGATIGAVFGFLSGVAFAFALNGYRQAGLALEPHFPIYSATASVCIAQVLQSAVLLIYLGAYRPAALVAVAKSWRQSLAAGVFGAAASG